MKTYRLEVDDNILDKVLWMLQHFKNDGVVLKEEIAEPVIDVKSSIIQAVNELNMVKDGTLKARPVEDLLNAL